MSNIRGGPEGAYGQAKGRSRAIKNHAYGAPDDKRNEVARISSHLSTENYHSNQVLPAVNEYQEGQPKSSMFDPLPAEGSFRGVDKHGLDKSSSKDLR